MYIYVFIYLPPCFNMLEHESMFEAISFQRLHSRDFPQRLRVQRITSILQNTQKSSHRIKLCKRPRASSLHSLLGCLPPFRHPKQIENKSVNKICVFEICASCGLPKKITRIDQSMARGINLFFLFAKV